MRFLHALALSALVLGAECVHFKIPEVEDIIAVVLSEHADRIHFEGNHTAVTHTNTTGAVSKRQSSSYWYENIAHQGISAFGPSGYPVFRNVRLYGAKGDGSTDDTAAINAAISASGRCGAGCASTTVTPAVVYFPAGTYLISSSINDLYYTQLIGDPTNMPTLKATANFAGFGLIDGDHYDTKDLRWGSTNVFFRQIRNFKFDTSNIPPGNQATGIHWPTAQATSLQNLVFNMPAGSQHVGIFCESGSAGFMTDLTFNGGLIGLQVGNQQFTIRNLVFNGCTTAIAQLWDWGFTYQGISINNCQKGFDFSSINTSTGTLNVGSVAIIDSTITNTPVGIISAYRSDSQPPTAGGLILENVVLSNVPTAIQQSSGATVLAGGSMTIAGWGEGNEYTPNGPTKFQGTYTPTARSASLLSGSKYYVRSKPQYADRPASAFASVRSAGARGDGNTDDTAALQNVINSATAAGNIVFFDAGTYKVTSTLTIPAGAKLVGESFSVIMSSGAYFNDINNPKPVVRVGTPGAAGQVEWSDMIVATQGTQAGAILIEWNLATSGTPSGMWDVHARIGGFAGSNQQLAQCAKNPGSTAVNTNCIVGYMTMHVTPSAGGLYMENVWLWTADHDIEDQGNGQITLYNGRGLYIESTAGTFWLVGTAVEHHTLYQYQLANTQNIFMGFIQTETPYYQPNPLAPTPFSVNSALNDPNFAISCAGQSGNCAEAWGLRILNSKNILVYGAGHYSFFNNYDTTCSNNPGPENCQNNIVSLEGGLSNVVIYCLSTVGTTNMVTENGATLAKYSDNIGPFPDNIALFQLSAAGGGPTTATPPPTTLATTTRASTTTTTAVTSPTGSAPAGWTFSGCYTDSINARTLSYTAGVPGGAAALTIEACISTCQSLGYTLAGVEYSSECYCDTALRNGGGPAPDGAAQCTMACNGNHAETCGGPNRLDLYSKNGAPPPPPSTTITPPSTTTTASTPTTTAGGPKTWHFLGCYTDSVSARTLTWAQTVPNGPGALTVEVCQGLCAKAGYSLAGVEYAVECYCDNALQHGGGPAPDGNAGCNMACGGNAAETCGGGNRLDLYQLS